MVNSASLRPLTSPLDCFDGTPMDTYTLVNPYMESQYYLVFIVVKKRSCLEFWLFVFFLCLAQGSTYRLAQPMFSPFLNFLFFFSDRHLCVSACE